MKKKLSLLAAFAWFFMLNINAKDIYLSATGNDANNGLTTVAAVKTLTRLNEIVGMEDVIHVNGVIKITDEPDFETKIEDGTQDPPTPENGIYLYHRGYFIRQAIKWAGVTFLGEDPARDGFSGEERAPLFQFDGANPVTFKNLVFMKAVTHRAANGQYGSDASAFWVSHTDLTFENCIFTQNDITRNESNPVDPRDGWGDRGALTVNSGNVIFKKCEFTENFGKEGGALFLGAGNIDIEDCYFGYNNCAEINDSKGGAICTWVHGADGALNINIKRTIFEGNTARKGGAIAFLDKVSYQPTFTSVNIDRCSFTGNQATQNQGGAILLDNFMGRQSRDSLSISNSVFYGNSANDYGGAICVWNVQPNSVLNMTNATLYGNFTNGNTGHGPGISFMTGYETYLPQNLEKHIKNCIFDGNYALGGETGTTYADLTTLYTPQDYTDVFELKNCYVGNVIGLTGHTGIDLETTQVNYYTESAYDDTFAALDDPDYYGTNYYTLPLTPTSTARTYGDADFLVGAHDYSGKRWLIAEGKCAIGASEVTSQELDDEVDFGTTITTPTTTAPVKLVFANGRLLCIGEGKTNTHIELYSIAGNKVASGKSNLKLPALAPGVYIAAIQAGATVYKQKIIINAH
jgi:predicted outer membrane repeat protein